ncbi:MAG: NUDIX domain-containing protein [Candidatus Veblenbacteria bacterium]|nr:NUDIX domain-containing protein [Candidatus Veblenbacteria bacterium]
MPHIHEKIDFTVDVYVVYQNRVLLRVHDKYGIWLGVGGHIELYEDPNQAAIREVKEEVGLDVTLVSTSTSPRTEAPQYQELIAPRFLNRHKINETHEHVSLVYFATSATDKVVPGAGEKETQWKWFSKEELQDSQYAFRDSVRLYAQKAMEEVVK